MLGKVKGTASDLEFVFIAGRESQAASEVALG